MKCSYHPDKDAVGACARCGAPLCAECAPGAVPADKTFFCSRCEAAQAAGEILSAESRRQEERRSREAERDRRRPWAAVFPWALAAVCLAVVLYQVPALLSASGQAEKPIRRGTYETDALTDRCIRNLWIVSKRLQEGTPLGDDIRCPASSEPFEVVREPDDVVVRAPRPELYGVREIRVSKRRPIPEVVR